MSHEIWRLFYPDTDTDPDLESLVNFIVTDQRGLGGASISLGYVSPLSLLLPLYITTQGLTAPIIWILLTQLANPSTNKKRRNEELPLTGAFSGKEIEESGTKNDKISLLGDVLPGMLTKNGVLTRIVINGVLVRDDAAQT